MPAPKYTSDASSFEDVELAARLKSNRERRSNKIAKPHHRHSLKQPTPQAQPSMQSPPSSSTPSPSPTGDTSDSPPKSAKRIAREALLERKASKQRLESLLLSSSTILSSTTTSTTTTTFTLSHSKPPRSIPPCSNCHPRSPWCTIPLSLPPTDWSSTLKSATSLSSSLNSSLDQHQHNYELDTDGCYVIPGGGNMRALVVSSVRDVPAALALLRKSMEDSLIAVDLEWRPDHRLYSSDNNNNNGGGRYGNNNNNSKNTSSNSSNNKVALMQLASANLAVLFRICTMNYTLPPSLLQFLSDPTIYYMSFSWHSGDESKMKSTFGAGHSLFSNLLDLQHICHGVLGYPHNYGLAALAKRVLGIEPPKDRKVSMSNWERRTLSTQQVLYAALDALLTGHVYRGLRLWHHYHSGNEASSQCGVCQQAFGMKIPIPKTLYCTDCGKCFDTAGGLKQHAKQDGHRPSYHDCEECGRITTVGT